jgi:hypothetical protein
VTVVAQKANAPGILYTAMLRVRFPPSHPDTVERK